MIKIKDNYRLPVVLSIGILLMLIETTGSLFSKSLTLLSYAGFILAVSFSALPIIAERNIDISEPEGFKRSQFYSISINCLMLLAIAAYIIYKSIDIFVNPRGINPSLACWMAFSAFVGMVSCVIIIYPEINKNKSLKALFFKYIFCALLSPFIIAASIIYYIKDMYFIDSAVSIFIAVLIIAQVLLLMKQALFELMRKQQSL